MKEKLKPSRLIAYAAGLMLLALGIAASVRSDLGSSPVASVPFFALVVFLLSTPFAWLVHHIPGVGSYLT